ncbi:hypothetical protein M405DRAFT_835350, partial [Rhizopogon salebrosus TDB-379]
SSAIRGTQLRFPPRRNFGSRHGPNGLFDRVSSLFHRSQSNFNESTENSRQVVPPPITVSSAPVTMTVRGHTSPPIVDTHFAKPKELPGAPKANDNCVLVRDEDFDTPPSPSNPNSQQASAVVQTMPRVHGGGLLC